MSTPPSFSFAAVDHPLDVGLLRHVGLHGVNFAAGFLGQFIARLVDLVERAARDQHAHAFLQKLPRGFKADAAAAAGDDGALSLDA